MIKIDTGITKIEGNHEEIMADLSTAISGIKETLFRMLGVNENAAEEKILLAVERGFLINKEMDSSTAYEIRKISEKINGGKI